MAGKRRLMCVCRAAQSMQHLKKSLTSSLPGGPARVKKNRRPSRPRRRWIDFSRAGPLYWEIGGSCAVLPFFG